MIYLEFLKFIRRPGPSLLPIIFMIGTAFIIGFLKPEGLDSTLLNLLFCLLISLSLKINFGHLLTQEQNLGMVPLIAKSPYGFLRFISFKIILHTFMLSLPSVILGFLIAFKGFYLIPLFVLVLMVNQTTLEVLLSNLNAPPGSQFLSAIILLPLEIPLLLLVATPDLADIFRIKILLGALFISTVIFKGVWGLVGVKQVKKS